MSGYLRPHELQHARLPCPSPSPRVCSDLCPLSWWCYLAISSSIPFSSCLQSFPASGSFLVSQLFTSGGQIIGTSASASVLPMNIQDWLPLVWFLLVWSPFSKGLSRVFYIPTVQRHQFFSAEPSLWSNFHMTTRKSIALTIWTFVNKMMPLLFNMLSRFVIAYLPRSKHLFISWVQWPSSVILKPKEIKSLTVSTFPHLFRMKWWDQMPWS